MSKLLIKANSVLYTILLSSVILCSYSCKKPTEENKVRNLVYKGDTYKYTRGWDKPGPDQKVVESYDTLSTQIWVNADADSISFLMDMQGYEQRFLKFLKADSIGSGTYMIATLRPMEGYTFEGDTLRYFYTLAAPTEPNLETKSSKAAPER